ncbi:uncharacterized protein LOC120633974 [Pararge aegeria]|uniref:uncharacterized protein LOC120633974 n=1 Tax=Pararge aegeria TaxID=116150 RepID=UPI0019CF602E|nr:uncharacterized protein LOC120633974 [Pararge aegeria]
MEDRTSNLEIKINQQQKTIDYLERQARKKNLEFYGVEETEQGYEELQNTLLRCIRNYMKITIEQSEIEFVRRLGKKENKIRPLLVTFTTLGRKIEILKKKGALKGSVVNIKEDFPPNVLLKRKELQEEVEKERKLGRNVVLRYDKIVRLPGNFKNRNYMSDTRKQKRNLSASPEHQITLVNESNARQISKKNKTNNITSYMNNITLKKGLESSSTRLHINQ